MHPAPDDHRVEELQGEDYRERATDHEAEPIEVRVRIRERVVDCELDAHAHEHDRHGHGLPHRLLHRGPHLGGEQQRLSHALVRGAAMCLRELLRCLLPNEVEKPLPLFMASPRASRAFKPPDLACSNCLISRASSSLSSLMRVLLPL